MTRYNDATLVEDANGKTLALGAIVGCGEDKGTITKITEVDCDYDDDLMRPVLYTPNVSVRFEDGSEDTFGTSVPWRGMYVEAPFVCEDVHLLMAPACTVGAVCGQPDCPVCGTATVSS
jgi:hypothetical protein